MSQRIRLWHQSPLGSNVRPPIDQVWHHPGGITNDLIIRITVGLAGCHRWRSRMSQRIRL
eukprot:700940-Karenia_brevis.AAC.1